MRERATRPPRPDRLPRRRSLFSQVVENLGQRIVRGDFMPGTSLPREATLSLEFNASRSVIREAVKSLAAKGLIESRTRTGISVLPPMRWNLLDPEVLAWRYSAMPPLAFHREIFEIRSLIEPHAAALAAERAGRPDLAEMTAAYAAMEAASEPGSEAIEADLRFHRAILAGARNELLLQMGNLIGVGLTVSYRLSSESFAVFLPLHRQVLEAIRAHDADGARLAMAKLLGDTRAFLDRRLGGQRARTTRGRAGEKPRARAKR
jgi:GntR family transcriptional regulator, galactonate operon transcriptional repressor